MHIGDIPIMLHSKYCLLYGQEPETVRLMGESSNEQGGYFIIHGKEKTVIAQEQTMAINILYLTNYGKSNNKWSHKVDIFSREENVNTAPKLFSIRMAKERDSESALTIFEPFTLYVHVPYIRKEVPLFILLRALGLDSDKDIIKHIVYNLEEPVSKKMMDILYYSIIDSDPIYTRQEAFNYLVSLTKGRKPEYLHWVFKYELLPHVGDTWVG
jgi:DNA-directed RNA polymerase, beta subunit/140 kD subunit